MGAKAGHRAVMYDPEDQALEMFGGYVGETLLQLLADGGSKQQVVGQAEQIPCLAAKLMWADRIKGRQVVHYIGNEAAKFVLIKGTSPTRDSAWLVHEFWKMEANAETHTWMDRAPSVSNCADHPSRGRWKTLKGLDLKPRVRKSSFGFEERLLDQWVQNSQVVGAETRIRMLNSDVRSLIK